IFNLLVITAIAYAARTFVPAGQTITGSGAALAFGFLLIAALQIGHLADEIRLPHLTGYILCGLVFGPRLLNIVTRAMLNDLTLVQGTAVGLIALLAGCELNFRKLRPRLRAITSIAVLTMLCTGIALWIVFFWIASTLPLTASYTIVERATVALVGANVLAAFSPAVVVALINETKSAGPLTELCMSIVVLADLAMVVTFSITSTIARSVFPSNQTGGGVGILAEHIFGSIFVGLIVGFVLAVYSRRVRTRTGLVVFALLFIVAEAGRVVHLDPLLVGLTAGLLLENASPVAGAEVEEAAKGVALPTFAIFFSVVGAEMDLGAFFNVAQFAAVSWLVRAGAIFGGSALGSRVGRVPRETARLVPLGLMPQAGVAIALAVLVLNGFQPWGRVLGTVLLGSIIVNELIGPVLFRLALARAGEIGAAGEAAADAHMIHAS
ncbi:MAG TPA: cation:proton antiporter, partial [Thermoanaerobaculia bacterium]|nr:cation:proton antiporter [Thermoanaerobaculia bacterium]